MSQFEVLQKIGLSKTAIRCYACLLEFGPTTVHGLAEQLGVSRTNLYGVLAKLTEQGFITEFKMTSQPALFTARPLNQAMREYYLYHRHFVLALCHELGVSSPPIPPPVLNRRI